MTKLHELYAQQGQSPWIDNLTRPGLQSGHLAQLVEDGVRGVTSNPTIFQKAMAGSDAYDEQFRSLIESCSVEDAYWQMVFDDIRHACRVLRPLYDESGETDGFVSLELAPALAGDTKGSVEQARRFHNDLAEPNLLVKIPATAPGVPAVQTMIAEGRNINITLIFSLDRYDEIIEAYISGLEQYDGNLVEVSSVASFFVSRVDTEVDRRLEAIGSDEALGLRGRTAVAQAKLAYDLFRQRFSGDRWKALEARGARVQRPLWASTSTKNPAYHELLYINTLIGPDTVNTMPDQTMDAFRDHGVVARTVDEDTDDARRALDQVQEVGVDLDDVARTLEEEGVAAFVKSYDELIQSLEDKANEVSS